MFMFRERFQFGAVFPFCIFKLLTTELDWIKFFYICFFQLPDILLKQQFSSMFAKKDKIHSGFKITCKK